MAASLPEVCENARLRCRAFPLPLQNLEIDIVLVASSAPMNAGGTVICCPFGKQHLDGVTARRRSSTAGTNLFSMRRIR
jgi:hypothetical protein